MKKRFLIVLIAAMCSSVLYGQSALEVMQSAYDREDGQDRRTVTTMTLINKRGSERVRQLISYSKDYKNDETRTLMSFLEPADVRGVGFLSYTYGDASVDDDRWLYLPAMKRVRRISGSSKNDNFMGTDFTYDDMGDRTPDEDTHALIGEETISGSLCWVIESVPKEPDHIYSKRTLWVRQDNFVVIKADYFDRQKNLLKQLTVTDLREQDGIWTIFSMEMRNIQSEHSTRISIDEILYNQGVEDSMFRVSTIERGRIR